MLRHTVCFKVMLSILKSSVCIFVFRTVHLLLCVCVRVRVCVRLSSSVCLCVRVRVCVRLSASVCLCVCVRVCVRLSASVCVLFISVRVYVYLCICACRPNVQFKTIRPICMLRLSPYIGQRRITSRLFIL
jgi:hypothetical protein